MVLGGLPGGPLAKIPCSQRKRPPGSIPGQGTRSHMPQLLPGTARYIFLLKKKFEATILKRQGTAVAPVSALTPENSSPGQSSTRGQGEKSPQGNQIL